MSQDVAQRDLDLSGFRVLKVGDPQAPGDATRTDNTTVPQPNAITGLAGQSLLAAPADHVHPIASNHFPYVLSLSDPTEQAQVGATEALIAQFPIEFTPLPLGQLIATLAAVVQVDSGTGTFNLRLGPTPDTIDGDILATITTASPSFELKVNTSNVFVDPGVPTFLKITAASDSTATARIKNKTVVLKSVG